MIRHLAHSSIRILLLITPFIWIEGVRYLALDTFVISESIWRFSFIFLIIGLAWLGTPRSIRHCQWIWPWPTAVVLGIGLVSTWWYLQETSTLAAWMMVGSGYLCLLWLTSVVFSGFPVRWRPLPPIIIASIAGLITIVLAQIESTFADEEFFAALQWVVLTGLWWWVWLAWHSATRLIAPPTIVGITLILPRLRILFPLGLATLLCIGFLTWQAYLHSFFPDHAPSYAGISKEEPFLCGKVPPVSQIYDGEVVFNQMLDMIKINPLNNAPKHGILAIATGDRSWAEQFRQQILIEAKQNLFTGSVQSVKYTQYEAISRVYYYFYVQQAFPDLFTPTDKELLRSWFAAINRRTLTVEWVDWAYSLALGTWPEGPYANQESGAALLSLLTMTGLADPELEDQNQSYLARHPGGWSLRFRNTDDAIIYQPEWMSNAYVQSLANGTADPDQIRRSIDWLLIQSLPDGMPLQYNYPIAQSSDGVAYLAAHLLNDPAYIWLAGRALEGRAATLGFTGVQLGVERPLHAVAPSPTLGSCLVFGDSGMPNQVGPLAPDKIVFRDGWEPDSAYAMLNLRFTGWHRYKATNTLTLVYQSGSLIADQLQSEPFRWLPRGRSFFRDKRIPRENLSGLLVPRTGLSHLIGQLTGGGPWAQDPPFYAEVTAFALETDYAMSSTQLHNWRGWSQQRSMWFYHGGPMIVYDQANGPLQSQAAIAWNLPQVAGSLQAGRIRLRESPHLAELVFVGAGSLQIQTQPYAAKQILAYPTEPGKIDLITVLLRDAWVGSDVQVDAEHSQITIDNGSQQIVTNLVYN